MQVIRVHGKPRQVAIQGKVFDYQEKIWVQVERNWFEQLDYDNHFIFKQDINYGAALMCTCGGVAGIFGYEAYSKYSSTNRGRLLCCVNHAQTGFHTDGST